MKAKLKSNPWLYIILGLGIFLRIYYIVTTPVCNLGQYDLGGAIPEQGILNGHIGYIYYLFLNKAIPNFDPLSVYEFYQPPTHYIISALWLSFVSLFTKSQELQTELIQVVPFVSSVLQIFVVYKICKEWGFKEYATNLVMATLCFSPGMIMLSGSINNDNLSYLFHFIVILCAIRWYKCRNTKNIVILALAIGIGMLAKLSTGMVAVPVAFMFLYVFIGDIRSNKKFPGKRFLQYVIFGIICCPIGLLWVVRCNLKFGVPLNYVGTLSDETWGYVGNYSTASRMLPPNPITLLNNIKGGGIGYSQNVWVQMIRTSSCTEADMAAFPMWAKLTIVLMMGIVFITAFVSFVGLFRSFVIGYGKNEVVNMSMCHDMGLRLFWLVGYATLMYSYFSFAYKFPQQCSMNFRYIVPVLMYPAVGLAMWLEREGTAKWIKKTVNIIFAAYALWSAVLVLTWCIYTP